MADSRVEPEREGGNIHQVRAWWEISGGVEDDDDAAAAAYDADDKPSENLGGSTGLSEHWWNWDSLP